MSTHKVLATTHALRLPRGSTPLKQLFYDLLIPQAIFRPIWLAELRLRYEEIELNICEESETILLQLMLDITHNAFLQFCIFLLHDRLQEYAYTYLITKKKPLLVVFTPQAIHINIKLFRRLFDHRPMYPTKQPYPDKDYREQEERVKERRASPTPKVVEANLLYCSWKMRDNLDIGSYQRFLNRLVANVETAHRQRQQFQQAVNNSGHHNAIFNLPPLVQLPPDFLVPNQHQILNMRTRQFNIRNDDQTYFNSPTCAPGCGCRSHAYNLPLLDVADQMQKLCQTMENLTLMQPSVGNLSAQSGGRGVLTRQATVPNLFNLVNQPHVAPISSQPVSILQPYERNFFMTTPSVTAPFFSYINQLAPITWTNPPMSISGEPPILRPIPVNTTSIQNIHSQTSEANVNNTSTSLITPLDYSMRYMNTLPTNRYMPYASVSLTPSTSSMTSTEVGQEELARDPLLPMETRDRELETPNPLETLLNQ